MTEFGFPDTSVSIHSFTAGPDDNLWFTVNGENDSSIGRITTAGTITAFPIPSRLRYLEEFTKGPDGNLWFHGTDFDVDVNSRFVICRITPDGVFTQAADSPGHPAGIVDGPNSTLWFVADVVNEVCRITILNDGPPPTANQRYVRLLYSEMLERDTDPAGLAFWSDQLDRGVSRQDVSLTIATSLESRTKLVTKSYQELLGRAPDEVGLTNSVQFLGQGGTLEQTKIVFLSSPEYLQKNRVGNAQTFLTVLYRDALFRSVDPGGAQLFGNALASGASFRDVAAGVLGSREARAGSINAIFGTVLKRRADGSGLETFLNALNAGIGDLRVLAVIAASDENFARANK